MKVERMLSVAAAVAGMCVASTAFAQVANGTPGNLVVNGSMDFVDSGGHPSLPGGDHFAGDSAATLTGWSFLNTGPTAEYWVAFQSQPSADGGNYLGIQDLDGFAPRNNVHGISQTVSGLQVGADYTLTFWSMSNHDGNGTKQDWDVAFGAQSRTGQPTAPNPDQSGNWVQSSMNFTASSTSQALTFVAQYLPGSVPEMLNLDGVVLEKVSAVPEPSSWALLLAGLGGTLAFARLRRPR